MANSNYIFHVSAAGPNPVVSGDKRLTLRNILNLFGAILNGQRAGGGNLSVQAEHTGVAATGTITLASCAAGTVLEVNGVPFTALSGTATVANNEFDISGTDTEDAAALAAAINNSTTAGISGVITATSALGVVTITNSRKGPGGNALTIKTLGVVATGIVTYVTPSGAQTVVVNGVTVYSATAGATATLTAAAAAAAINASSNALIAGHVRALSRAGVCHVFAVKPGTVGNAITMTVTGTGATATVTNGRLASGAEAESGGAQATATLTLTSWLNTETVAVNGVTITAHTNTQANNQVDISGSDTADAANLALAINNSTTAALKDVVATSASAVVTITARKGGTSGNAITVSSGQASVVASAARLAGGAAPLTVAMSADRLTSGSSTSTTFAF